MSRSFQTACPDWQPAIAARLATGDDPAGWPALREHLAACPDCRRQALAADPMLVFTRLPQTTVGSLDIEAMKQGVAAMRRASRVAPAEEARPVRQSWTGRSWASSHWRSLAAAALLGTVVILLPGPGTVHQPTPIDRLSSQTATPIDPLSTRLARFETAPEEAALEDLDSNPGTRVYQMSGDEMQVVMIVDPSLDL